MCTITCNATFASATVALLSKHTGVKQLANAYWILHRNILGNLYIDWYKMRNKAYSPVCPTLTDWLDIEHTLEYFIVTKFQDMVLVPTEQKNDPHRVALSTALQYIVAFNIAPRFVTSKTNCAYSGQHPSTCTSLQSRQTGQGFDQIASIPRNIRKIVSYVLSFQTYGLTCFILNEP